MTAIRFSTLVSAAAVLLISGLASRTRLGAGIAVAVLGLLLAYARGFLAVSVVALVAAAVLATGAFAKGALILVMVASALAAVHVAVLHSATFASTRRPRGERDWWGFSDGWGRDSTGGGGGT